jgi:hypothetical protein
MGGRLTSYGETPLAVRAVLRTGHVLIPWTVAVFLMGLRRPRPPLRRLVLRPGMAACGAVTLRLGLNRLLLALMGIGTPTRWVLFRAYLGDGAALVSRAAPAVAGSWLVPVLSGRWCPARGWFDRLGRVLGVSWLALEALNSIRTLF